MIVLLWVYWPEEGVLEVRAPGTTTEIDALISVFCGAVLHAAAPSGPRPGGFTLERLLDPDFRFHHAATDGIEAVDVTEMEVQRGRLGASRLTFGAPPCALPAFLDQLGAVVSVPRADMVVRSVRLRARFQAVGRAWGRSVVFRMSAPDTTDLVGGAPEHLRLRRLLGEWGLAA